MSGFDVPAEPVENMRLREEHRPVEWKEYAWVGCRERLTALEGREPGLTSPALGPGN
jgi:hypothetical protein